ncbi:MAG: O-acetyl-ADP-ribose deacetylase [Candidatus Eremiobacteraeota bacterium]|nr:O-acetyl-ADP-ribose deacetylase [Candidatus Eremiobacteraeota bacterium]
MGPPASAISARLWNGWSDSTRRSISNCPPRNPRRVSKLTLLRGDITKLEVDAIVNAANSSLLGGGGVDGAIHRAGGPAILQDCQAIRARQGGCKTGEAVITGGGNLPARHVIHTVGPVWRGGQFDEAHLLANCYRNSLQLALEQGLKTLAFPCISTGVFGYPLEEAAPIAVETVREFLGGHPGIEEVVFCVFSPAEEKLYSALLNA